MIGVDVLAALTQRQKGVKVWSAKKGIGTFVTIDFGERLRETSTRESQTEYGTLHLWIQYCAWKLYHNGNVILSSESQTEDYSPALERLSETALVSISATNEEINVRFSEGFVMHLHSDTDQYDPDDDLMVIFEQGRPPLGYSVEQGVYYEVSAP